MYFGVTTPVVHFTMGGIKVNPSNAKVVTKSGDTISNLFAIGEVSAGVHGNNRLGDLPYLNVLYLVDLLVRIYFQAKTSSQSI